MTAKLVIVYHRQPYEEVIEDGKLVRKENKSPNGIVPTLKSFFGRHDSGAWIAWKYADDPTDPDFERRVTIEDSYGTYTVSRLPLTKEQVSSFYHVTSKEAIWPILHSFKDRYNYDPVDWPTFREVNWAFAEAAAHEADDDSVIWVHDYNLWLVPAYVRRLKPKAKIAFFHHTPFPAADMFNVLPWRREIIESLLDCDIVGFHIPRYAANFVSTAFSRFDIEVTLREKTREDFSPQGQALSEQATPTEIAYQGRRIQLSSFPVGVDVEFIEELTARPETAALEGQIREELAGKKLIISVGRTDYTKGGIELLQAYERLLQRQPDLSGQVRLMHVSVSANRNMEAYAEVQEAIEAMAGRINGTYGSFEWQPVSLISTPIPFPELVAYYRAADIAWITPLADGLNLVAEEFVAARTDGDGVLVLSEFAGVAVEMAEAVLCNPFSHRSMDAAIEQALTMDEADRRARMRALRAKVHRYDIEAWAREQQRLFDLIAGDGPAGGAADGAADGAANGAAALSRPGVITAMR
ncbi:MAG: glucosylglycerol-phosphate synthase [Pseudomonadota bacterium]